MSSDPAAEIFAFLTKMRESDPVHRDEQGVWQVFDHAGVTRILGDAATFSSDTSGFVPETPEFEPFRTGNIVNIDPPLHRQLRGLIVEVFTPRVVDALTPKIGHIAEELLDAADGDGRFELVETLSYPLPVIVIAELLGVPGTDRPLFHRWADRLLNRDDFGAEVLPDEKLMDELAPTMREMTDYLRAQIAARRTRPTDDLIGRLAEAEVDGMRLSDNQIVGFAATLLLAGHITTTATLGNAVYLFNANPSAAADLRANPDLLPAAIEEVLRYRSPFPRVSRVTTTDVEVGGRTIPAGEMVIGWLAAANRDPAKFPDPDRFDIHRATTGHVAFGHGIHFCIGSRLARLEARVTLAALFDRYRDITVETGSPTEFQNPWVMNAVSRLPLAVGK